MVSYSVFSDSWNRLHRCYCWSSEIGLEFICKSTSCCRFSDLKKEGIISGSSNLQEASFRSSNHWRRRCVWSNKKCFIWRISIHYFGKAFVAPWVPQDITLWFFRVACTQLVINVVQDVVQVLSRVYVCVVFSAPSGQTLMHIVEWGCHSWESLASR